jgi:hypothetical protein
MAEIDFDFYGVRARLSSESKESLSELARDFAWFRTEEKANPDIRLTLIFAEPPSQRSPADSGPGGKYRATDRGSVRTVHQPGGGLVVHDFSREEGTIACADPHRLHEVTYILLLSRVGEMLDRRGLHRVHALGFVRDDRAALLLAPIGGGKTTLALELLRKPGVSLLSEDTPLVDREGRLWPFPVRFGVVGKEFRPDIPAESQRIFHRREHGSKVLIDVDVAADRWAPRRPVEPSFLFVAGGFSGETIVSPGGPFTVLPALLAGLVIGIGIPQGREYLLRPRPTQFFRLARIAVSRARAMAALLRRCRVFAVRLGPDAGRTLESLSRLWPSRET